jgi:Family of unknown function (DUF6074)
MTATVLPFPLTCRRPFVLRCGARIAAARPTTGDKLLAHVLTVQADTMERRGIDARLIEREITGLERAILVEALRLRRGGAA